MRARVVALNFIVFAIVAASSACASRGTTEDMKKTVPVDRKGYFADPVDFVGVFFESGKPEDAAAEDLSALSESRRSTEKSLEHDLRVISTFPPNTVFEVFGFTDSKECAGDQCIALSLRRAQLVYDWFVAKGVPKERLMPPRGYGSARPIGDNSTVDGRAMNRRAYIADRL